MAPDLNGVAKGQAWDYSAPGAGGYNIPDITLNDPSNRKIKVICMGSGISGILSAYQIQKHCQNVDFTLYEKNADIGGVWFQNKYPGAACDIPAHAYTYNFALNPDWPSFFAYRHDIWGYLDKVCATFGLRKYMNFNSEIIGAWWQEETGKWLVRIRETQDGKEVRVFDDEGDMLLAATGTLNNWEMPKIDGINDFKGRIVHTAGWPSDYQAEQWKDDSVIVIGSGASSIQTVPTMQPHVKHMDVFVRTPIWFVDMAGNHGSNKVYSEGEREEFNKDSHSLAAHAKSLEDQVNGLWGAFYSGTELQGMVQDMFRNRMGTIIKDERLLKGYTPSFGIGCRRITPGDPYMRAIQESNVDVHFAAVDKITAEGVIGSDGIERKADTIVCATGFDVSYRPRFPLVGRNGTDLRDKWAVCPESYLGLAVPELPNFLMFVGPTWPIENGSLMGGVGLVAEYAIQMIKKMQYENIHSLTPKQEVSDMFNEHVQEWVKHTVWKDNCRSWYKNNETGRVNAIWCGSLLHYMRVIRTPRYEDYDIRYHKIPAIPAMDGKSAFGGNMWSFLGSGFAIEDRPIGKQAGLDVSPYIKVSNIDPLWLEACGVPAEKAKEMVINAMVSEAREEAEARYERARKGENGSIFVKYHDVGPRVFI